MVVPTLTLSNGLTMPAFGLGTYASVGGEGTQAVKDAIDAGYRHFDSAYLYANEAEVGQGILDKIADGTVKREDIFYTTKLWGNFHEPKHVERIFRKSLENSGLDYIDLYLMHFPVGFTYYSDENSWPKNADGTQDVSDVDFVDTYKAMENLVKLGLVKSIGVSNFNSEQIQRILDECEIKPVTNQIECSPTLNQKDLIKFCKERDITVTAYSPLGQGNPTLKTPAYLYDEKVQVIGDKYGKTAGQVILRYVYELGTIPIPKSSNKGRIQQNIDIFDFELTEDETKYFDSFYTGKRVIGLSDAKHSKYWPFSIPF